MLRVYGLNMERAERDGNSAAFVADLAAQLPPVQQATNPDAAWGMVETLLALIFNQLNALTWGLGGGKGQKPPKIGPSWLVKANNSSLPMQVMPIEELEKRLKEFDERAAARRTQAQTIIQTY